MARPRARPLIVVLVVGLALVLAQGMEQGLQSHARLRTEFLESQRAALSYAFPDLAEAIRGGNQVAWSQGALVAMEAGVATEFEVFEQGGQLLFAHPRPSPVKHWPDRTQHQTLDRQQVLTLGPFPGEGARFLSYVALDQGGRHIILRLSRAAPTVASELRDYRKLMLGHGLGLVALAILAALAFSPSPASDTTRHGPLEAYEEAVQWLQARGRSHEAERQRLERAVQERTTMARAGDLTAGIVHEMRNGLATIVGHARLLDSSADVAEAARAILQECKTLETVIRRFLDFIREDALDLAPFDLGRFLSRVVGREARVHPGCQVSLPADGLGSLVADEDLLERAFENLVRNALEAAGAGGHVQISVERGAGRVAILIEDDGPGLDPLASPEPRAFFSTKAGGTGLGLPIAEKIVRLHNGELRLEPVSPRGLRARVELAQPSADS